MEQIKKEKDIDDGGRDIELTAFDIDFQMSAFPRSGDKGIEHVSFSIPEGSMTAIVGPSGSEKTTITKLLARFWDVQEAAF